MGSIDSAPQAQPASGEHVARNIVFQLGDLYELPVELRQRTNDEAIDFVQKLIAAARTEARREELEAISSIVLYETTWQPQLINHIKARLAELEGGE